MNERNIHGRHLGETDDDKSKPHECPHEGPEKTRQSAILEALGIGSRLC